MRVKAAIGLGFLLIIAVSGVAGAGIYRWSEDDKPNLYPEYVIALGETWIRTTDDLWNRCIGNPLKLPGETDAEYQEKRREVLLELRSYDRAVYLGDGYWTAEVGHCHFVVDDKTGKVTGP